MHQCPPVPAPLDRRQEDLSPWFDIPSELPIAYPYRVADSPPPASKPPLCAPIARDHPTSRSRPQYPHRFHKPSIPLQPGCVPSDADRPERLSKPFQPYHLPACPVTRLPKLATPCSGLLKARSNHPEPLDLPPVPEQLLRPEPHHQPVTPTTFLPSLPPSRESDRCGTHYTHLECLIEPYFPVPATECGDRISQCASPLLQAAYGNPRTPPSRDCYAFQQALPHPSCDNSSTPGHRLRHGARLPLSQDQGGENRDNPHTSDAPPYNTNSSKKPACCSSIRGSVHLPRTFRYPALPIRKSRKTDRPADIPPQ